MNQTESKTFLSKEEVESMARRKERLCLGSKIHRKIQLSIFVGCFTDAEWGRRDLKV